MILDKFSKIPTMKLSNIISLYRLSDVWHGDCCPFYVCPCVPVWMAGGEAHRRRCSYGAVHCFLEWILIIIQHISILDFSGSMLVFKSKFEYLSTDHCFFQYWHLDDIWHLFHFVNSVILGIYSCILFFIPRVVNRNNYFFSARYNTLTFGIYIRPPRNSWHSYKKWNQSRLPDKGKIFAS